MTADVQRKLAEALPCAANCTGPDDSWCRATRRAQASTLLPTVQALIADAEKRAAGAALREAAAELMAYSGRCAQPDARQITLFYGHQFRNYAAALDPTEPGRRAGQERQR